MLIEINEHILIPDEELTFKYSRSSGPGGQNINKVNTRVMVFFNLADSAGFSDEQKQIVLKRLGSRVDKNGIVRIVSQRYRTQAANKAAATARLVKLLQNALQKKRPRKKTKPSRASIERRLEAKKRRGLLKRQRMGTEYFGD